MALLDRFHERLNAIALGTEGDNHEAISLLAMTMLGVCRAVRVGAIGSDKACRFLFNPLLVRQLRSLHAKAELIEAAELATELEDVDALIPARLDAALDDIEQRIEKGIKGSVAAATDHKWNAFEP